MIAIQYDNVSCVNWFAQKQSFKVVCEDEFSNRDKSKHVFVYLSINDAQHGVRLLAFVVSLHSLSIADLIWIRYF